MIEAAPIQYISDRSFNNSMILLHEAQSTTKEQMKFFLTRLGQDFRAIITGDCNRIPEKQGRSQQFVGKKMIIQTYEQKTI